MTACQESQQPVATAFVVSRALFDALTSLNVNMAPGLATVLYSVAEQLQATIAAGPAEAVTYALLRDLWVAVDAGAELQRSGVYDNLPLHCTCG